MRFEPLTASAFNFREQSLRCLNGGLRTVDLMLLCIFQILHEESLSLIVYEIFYINLDKTKKRDRKHCSHSALHMISETK